jgi:hypothetical protein
MLVILFAYWGPLPTGLSWRGGTSLSLGPPARHHNLISQPTLSRREEMSKINLQKLFGNWSEQIVSLT